jgi:hypothetical protein
VTIQVDHEAIGGIVLRLEKFVNARLVRDDQGL